MTTTSSNHQNNPVRVESLWQFEVTGTEGKRNAKRTLVTEVASELEARERAESYGIKVISVRRLGPAKAVEMEANTATSGQPVSFTNPAQGGPISFKAPAKPASKGQVAVAIICIILSLTGLVVRIASIGSRSHSRPNYDSAAQDYMLNEQIRRTTMSPEMSRMDNETGRMFRLLQQIEAQRATTQPAR